ncbi:sugar diacid utilization regulator [Actinomadura pelletieri DSM 43383]|uniref:Sugar diacid utilization regulator n=1 Tax=Actinomadura pelletieri DSM 43383 TaxID=1120940 RepID=A0A495QXQ9_9ACTN|nr:helix-turn-helix domain-containing protein [Actinomadura pelletieri]RKS78975.1 sugar diacid utilization regulator [Actinomadura pelletieri DSM 43383]
MAPSDMSAAIAEPLATVARNLESASTALANEFVRQFVSAADSGAVDRQAPVEAFEMAVNVIGLCAAGLADDGPVGELSSARGSRVALQGRSVVEAVEWLRLLERVVTDHVLANADRDGNGIGLDDVRAVLGRLAELFDVLCTRELEAFTSTYNELAGWQARVSTDLLSCLISGAAVDASTVNDQARTLNINPHQPFRAVAAYHDPAPTAQQWARVRRRVMEVLWRHDPRREILLRERRGVLLALVPMDRAGPGVVPLLTEMLDGEPGRSLFVSAGEPGASLAAAGHSCRQALSALEISIYRDQRGQVTQCTDVILEVLLAHNRWVSNRLIETRIGQLVEKPHLLDTLRVYINCDMALQRTAEELLVHPNTVAYRLRQIATLTGRDMRRITDIGDLNVALMAYDAIQMRRDREEARTDLRARLFA